MPESLGARLIRAGLISRAELRVAIARTAARGEGLAEAIVAGGLDEGALVAQFAREGLRPVDEAILDELPEADLLDRIPRAMAEAFLALPLASATTGVIVAMVDPSDTYALEQLSLRLGSAILPRAARLSALRNAITRAFADREAPPPPRAPSPAAPRARLLVPAPVPFSLPEPDGLDSGWAEVEVERAPTPSPVRAPSQPPRARLTPRTLAADALAAPADLGVSLAALRNATCRDDVLRTACEAVLPVCAGVVFLGRRRDVLVGHECAGGDVSRDAVRSLFLPLSVPSSLRQAVETQRPYFGVYSTSDADRLFRASIGSRSLQVGIEPVFVGGRLTGVLCADDPRYGRAGAERISLVAHAAGAALARLILARRARL